MKTIYKGFELEVDRHPVDNVSSGTFGTATRLLDGKEIANEGPVAYSIPDMIDELRAIVDDFVLKETKEA